MLQTVVIPRHTQRELRSMFRHYARPARHRGQALLLVVLIMLIAALVGAGFLSIVSGNLSQTTRTTDRNKAVENARAGLAFVNDKLTNSLDGEQWFAHNYETGVDPTLARNSSTNPAALDLAADSNPFYYSELDKVQGWARNYAKFPDPNGKPVSNAPKFLVRVQRIPSNIPVADKLTNPEYSHQGQLKIIVIGLSEDDPNAWYRLIAYKGGTQSSPVGQVMRTISQWDYNHNVVPVALTNVYTASSGTTPATLTIKNKTGDFGQGPFTILIGNSSSATLQSAVVTGVDNNGTGSTLTLAQDLSTAPGSNVRVEVAASVGSPDGSLTTTGLNPVVRNGPDFLNDRTLDATDQAKMTYEVARTTPSGMYVNGSAIYFGKTQAENLLSYDQAHATSTGKTPATVQVSGLIGRGVTSSPVVAADVLYKGDAMASAVSVPNSNSSTFGTSVNDALLSDGVNRLNPKPGVTTRLAKPFTPPNFVSGDGLERYRNLTMDSAPNYQATVPNLASGAVTASSSRYGYGQGIYIDNREDREKYVVNNTLTEMPKAVLEQMWLNAPPPGDTKIPLYGRTPDVTTNFTAGTGERVLKFPVNYTAGPVSLEEQHVRGWISPNEFLPRGVLIEILANNTLRITRDSRDDNVSGTTPVVNATGPVLNKAWDDASSGTPQAGKYSQIFNWPADGVIFAEGNVRIVSEPRASTAEDPPCSLTVVSMNNVYIEGPLSLNRPTSATDDTPVVNPRKILLMARKNVVENPTRMLAQPDAQTVAPTGGALTAGLATTVSVASAANFNQGDYVRITTGAAGSETVAATALVSSVDPIANTLSLIGDSSITITANSVIRVPLENAYRYHASSVGVYYAGADKLNNAVAPYAGTSGLSNALVDEAVSRRVRIPGVVPAGLRFAFDHIGERQDAFKVGVTVTGAPPQEVFLSNKRVMATANDKAEVWSSGATGQQGKNSVVGSTTDATINNKVLRGDFKQTSATANDRDSYADPLQLLSAVSTDMNGKTHTLPQPPGADIDWKYNTSIPTTNRDYSTAPFFYMAGLGQRYYDYDTDPANPITDTLKFTPTKFSATDWRRRLYDPATPGVNSYTLPLATSVQFMFGAAQQALVSQNSTGTAYDTSYFGFNPTYVSDTTTLSATNVALRPEDATTVDQSFYRPNTVVADSIFDSRSISATFAAATTNGVVLRQPTNVTGVNTTATDLLPQYRLRNLKLEQVDVNTSTGAISAMRPGATINVDAYIVAQEGSWFVIPGGYFREKAVISNGTTIDASLIRGTSATACYYDFNNNGANDAGESIADGIGSSVPDFNHNGLADPAERVAALRYFRYNYQIKFTGAIAENRSAIVEDVDGTFAVKGAVADWTNKWASVTYNGTAPTYDTISYEFDPAYSLNSLTAVNSAATADRPAMKGDYDFGFQMPQSPDLSYTE